ncbi:MAG: hypothetical protein K2N92_00525 [Malacoplasma sp.]|nr:hypothetical protein [Malacoplasma sp.]MDE7112062.1 hypothetical protein [Malacoplasma sp.]
MINIFYNKTTLNNALTISVSSQPVTKIEKKKNFTVLYNNNNLVGINIWDFDQYEKINQGMIFADNKILQTIKKITQIDLSQYVEKNFVVGKIIQLEKIPNTHLHYCDVDIKDKTLKIICGASNVEVGTKVVVAMINTAMPDGKMILKSNIQGKVSFGMLCSKKELNLKADSSEKGIMILDNKYKIGDLFSEPFANK